MNPNSSFELDNIDKRQLWALIKVSLKIDLRGAQNPMGGNYSKGRLGLPPFLGLLLFYFLMGFGLAAIVWKVHDIYYGSLVLTSMVMIFCSITILLEFSNLILSPDDFPILAPHPVNSKTFFAAKLSHMTIYVTMMVSAQALVPSLATAWINSSVLLFPITFLAAWGAAMAASLFFAVFYTFMLRFTTGETLQRYLSYSQMFFIFGVYGAYYLLPQLMLGISYIQAHEAQMWYLYLTPPAWFASWVSLSSGAANEPQIAAAIFGLAFLGATLFVGVSRLSLGYAMTLTDLVEQHQARKMSKRTRGSISRLMGAITTPEDRAVWSLIRTQFKYDNRYKMSILTVIPLVVIYLVMGFARGQIISDPFHIVVSSLNKDMNIFIYVAVAMVPFLMIYSTAFSATHQAAWIYFTSPADYANLVLSTARFVTFFFCTPFLLFMLCIFTYMFGSFAHAFLHCAIIYLMLMLMVNLVALIFPRFPFSLPIQKGQRSFGLMVLNFVPMIAIVGPMALVSKFGYGGVTGYSIAMGALVILNLLFRRLQQKYIPRRLERIEFTEE